MDIKEMTAEQLVERRSAIATELDSPDADLDALEAEVRAINEELETRKNTEAKKADVRDAIANGTQPAEKIDIRQPRVWLLYNIVIKKKRHQLLHFFPKVYIILYVI